MPIKIEKINAMAEFCYFQPDLAKLEFVIISTL